MYSGVNYGKLNMSAKTVHAGFLVACNHNLTLVSKAPVISVTRAVLADVQARGRGDFAFMAKHHYHKIDFSGDVMCAKCGSWFIPVELSGDEVTCPNCRRITRQAKDRAKLDFSKLEAAWAKLMYDHADQFTSEGFVYFIRGRMTRRVKVGYTSGNAYSRMMDMRTGSPDLLELLGVVDATMVIEKELHSILEPYHSHGEWFDGNVALSKFIRRYTYLPPKPSFVTDQRSKFIETGYAATPIPIETAREGSNIAKTPETALLEPHTRFVIFSTRPNWILKSTIEWLDALSA